MKNALRVILPACLLLALAHLTSAQMSGPADFNCTSVQSLSSQCRRLVTDGTNTNQLCGGNCFGPVLRAFQNCESNGADAIALTIQEGEKKIMLY